MLYLIETAFPGEPDKHRLLEQLYIDHHRLMLRIAFDVLHDSSDAEDAVQQAFVQIINAFDSIERITDVQDVKSYMAVCAKYAALNLAAKKHHRREVITEPERINVIRMKQVSERDFDKYSSSYLNQYIGLLKPAYREILFLKYSCDLKDHEIASVVGQDRSTVSKRIKRALKKLKDLIENEAEGKYDE